jgi:PAS domain S-box-containing protein
MLQYGRDDLLSGIVRWTDLTPLEWRERDKRALAELKTTGTAQPYEKEFFRKDGSRAPVLIGGALFQEGGNEGVAFILDLSEQKRTEDALRHSESYLAQAQRLAHIGSWAWQAPGRNALYLSAEWYRLFGFDPKVGMPNWEQRLQRIHPEDRARVQATTDRAIAEKSDYEVEFRIVASHVPIRFIHSVGQPVMSASGELLHFVGVMMDVTARKYAEQEQERLRQELAHLAHLSRVSTMGELVASIAHELAQPITVTTAHAKASLRWLQRDPPDLTEVRKGTERIMEAGTLASEIIDRLRSLYKLAPPKRELVSINEVVGEMAGMLRSEARRRGVSIYTDIKDDLPMTVADRVQLQQVLMNLMLNGIGAMKDTGGELTLKSQLGEDGQIEISVNDTGPGLPLGNADQIFDAFFTTKPQGSGMGLAISKSIVESHRGRIWANGDHRCGATFHFTLPAASAETNPPLDAA